MKKRWTAILRWEETGTIEEVDIDAESKLDAERIVQRDFDTEYESGWNIEQIIGPRVGLYF